MEYKCNREAEMATIQSTLELVVDRVSKLEVRSEEQYKMSTSIALLAERMGVLVSEISDVRKEVEKVQTDVTTIKEEDGKSWNSFKLLSFTTSVSLIIGYLFRLLIGG